MAVVIWALLAGGALAAAFWIGRSTSRSAATPSPARPSAHGAKARALANGKINHLSAVLESLDEGIVCVDLAGRVRQGFSGGDQAAQAAAET